MLDLTKPHTWAALIVAVLVIGFVLHQLANRVPAASSVVKASFGS